MDFLDNFFSQVKNGPGMSAGGQGLLAAGLGILANNRGLTSGSQAIGLGGLQGLQVYNQAQSQELKNAQIEQLRRQMALSDRIYSLAGQGNPSPVPTRQMPGAGAQVPNPYMGRIGVGLQPPLPAMGPMGPNPSSGLGINPNIPSGLGIRNPYMGY